MKNKTIAFSIVVCLIIVSFLSITITNGSAIADLLDQGSLQSHSPIVIDGNSQFITANGVRYGNGTEENPYVIENWTIKRETADGIKIDNTNSFFVIRNCWIDDTRSNTSTPRYIAISFGNIQNGTVENCRITGIGGGIILDNSGNNTIRNNTGYDSGSGVCLNSDSDYNIIEFNNIHDNKNSGICLTFDCNNNIIRNNTLKNLGIPNIQNAAGIDIHRSSSNTIEGNNIEGNQHGIIIFDSTGIIIKNNHLVNNSENLNGYRHGLSISISEGITIKGNDFENCGIYLSGYDRENWNTHTIDTTNTVNERKIYYYKDTTTSTTVPSNAGQVILANSANFIISDQNFTGCGVGVLSGFSNNIDVLNSQFEDCEVGVRITEGENCLIKNNSFINNGYGINLLDTQDITIEYNDFDLCKHAILFLGTWNCIIRANHINNTSYYGIEMTNGSDNNQIIDNTIDGGSKGITAIYKSTIKNNTIKNHKKYGIYTTAPSIISQNTLIDNYYGIQADQCSQVTITTNTFILNTKAIYFPFLSSENTVSYNIIMNSRSYGLECKWDDAKENDIFYNDFINNNNGNTQAIDNGTGNQWNDTSGSGNHWSDWTSPDSNTDGIVDNPYAIAGTSGTKDHFPHTEPMVYEEPAFGAMNVTTDKDDYQVKENISISIINTGLKELSGQHPGFEILDNNDQLVYETEVVPAVVITLSSFESYHLGTWDQTYQNGTQVPLGTYHACVNFSGVSAKKMFRTIGEEPILDGIVINERTSIRYSKIQSAIDNAQDGDTIYVWEGDYKENKDKLYEECKQFLKGSN